MVTPLNRRPVFAASSNHSDGAIIRCAATASRLVQVLLRSSNVIDDEQRLRRDQRHCTVEKPPEVGKARGSSPAGSVSRAVRLAAGTARWTLVGCVRSATGKSRALSPVTSTGDRAREAHEEDDESGPQHRLRRILADAAVGDRRGQAPPASP